MKDDNSYPGELTMVKQMSRVKDLELERMQSRVKSSEGESV